MAYLDIAAVMAAGRASVASCRRPFEASVAYLDLMGSPSEVHPCLELVGGPSMVADRASVAFQLDFADSSVLAWALAACLELVVVVVAASVAAVVVVAFHCYLDSFHRIAAVVVAVEAATGLVAYLAFLESASVAAGAEAAVVVGADQASVAFSMAAIDSFDPASVACRLLALDLEPIVDLQHLAASCGLPAAAAV